MREVKIFKWERRNIEGKLTTVKELETVGWFHQFAQDDSGEGLQIPVAVVELADGTIRAVYAEMVQFLEHSDGADLVTAMRQIAKHESSEGYIAMRDLTAAGVA
jgi:hypothetical protein